MGLRCQEGNKLHVLHCWAPFPVIVTTRIISCLVGDSYKLSFATISGKGDNPTYPIYSFIHNIPVIIFIIFHSPIKNRILLGNLWHGHTWTIDWCWICFISQRQTKRRPASRLEKILSCTNSWWMSPMGVRYQWNHAIFLAATSNLVTYCWWLKSCTSW